MTLRKRLWFGAIVISASAAILSLASTAYVTSIALACASAFAWIQSRAQVSAGGNLEDWLIALESKDPFNPDAKPTYEFSGFATTFVVALRITNHPTLSRETFVAFRDEVNVDVWRAILTRVRHGPHTLRATATKQRWF
jgi:hypothetical protein